MKFIKSLVAIVITAFMLSISVCYADTADVEKIKDIYQDAAQRVKNITNMIQERYNMISLDDFRTAVEVQQSAKSTLFDIMHLTDFATLLSKMESAKDKSAVNAFISSQLDYLKKTCPQDIASLNGGIVDFKNPAMLAESQHLRDDVVKECDIVQHWK